MKTKIITILFFILSQLIYAQELLTLDKAVELGLKNNYGIQIAKNISQITKNNATPGNAGMLPRVDANAAYSRGTSDAKITVVTPAELDIKNAPWNLLTAGVKLEWTLFDGLSMFITRDKLKKLMDIGDLNAKIEVENVLAKIIGAYYDIVRREKEVTILKEQVDISRFRLELARLRYETGGGSELESLKAHVELNADSSALENQQTLLQNSKTVLNDLLSREINTPFTIWDSIPVTQVLNYDTLSFGLEHSNRELVLAGKNQEISFLDMKSAKARKWPTLDFISTYSYYRSSTEAHFIKYNRNFGPTIGASATVKLFDGRNLDREYQNSKVNMENSDLEMKQLENRLKAYLLMTYNNYRNEINLIGFEQENLVLARKNMEIAKESYKVGSISSLQLREIQKDLLSANTRLVTALFVAKLSETELLLLGGKLLN